jgi:hypothetical protein
MKYSDYQYKVITLVIRTSVHRVSGHMTVPVKIAVRIMKSTASSVMRLRWLLAKRRLKMARDSRGMLFRPVQLEGASSR